MTTPIRRMSRRMPGWAKAVSAVVLVLVVFFAGIRLSVLPGLKDLFGTETHDRSGPALLQSIQDISRYDAASGNFQVVVDLEKDTKAADVIKLKCDVHPWMTGWVVVHKHPFFATTTEDGKFSIKDVPAGTYTVEAWHEKLGSTTAEVKVEDGKDADPKLSFGDKKS